MEWHQNLFLYGLYASYILYAVILFGVSTKAPAYLSTLDNALKIYICLFLLLRFNPFMKTTFTEFDRRVVFSSAFFLLTTTTLVDVLEKYINVGPLLKIK
jgi:hypothetical protein